MIRRAIKEDLQLIMKMVDATVTIMKEEKSDQWNETYPTPDIFEQDIKNGSLYVLEEDGYVRGAITIDQNLPVEYNSPNILWRKTSQSYTAHRLVVDPTARKKGIASKLLAYAEYLARQNEVLYLKVDTYSINTKAQALFERNGFKKVGEMAFQQKTKPFFCYDKILN